MVTADLGTQKLFKLLSLVAYVIKHKFRAYVTIINLRSECSVTNVCH